MGSTLTVQVMELLAPIAAAIPNPFELMHYPLLFAGHVALFFTALNLFPIGQLDGGHILYGMVGPRVHRILSPLFFIMLVFYSGLGSAQPIDLNYDVNGWEKLQWNFFYLLFLVITFSKTAEGWLNTIMLALAVFAGQYVAAVAFPGIEGYQGWLVFCFVLGRFLGIYHPPALVEEPIGRTRMVVGGISILVFIASFSPKAFWFQ
jgi:membrane-associated protease RseP (regulator of RpoE activity)